MYLDGNKWAEYTLFPQYIVSPPWSKYVERLKASNALPAVLPPPFNHQTGIVANMAILRQMSSEIGGGVKRGSSYSGYGIDDDPAGRDVVHVGIVYATNGGSTAKRAEEAAQLFNQHLAGMVSIDARNIAEFVANWDDLAAFINTSHCILVLTSTCGSGDLPRPAAKFVDHLTEAQTDTFRRRALRPPRNSDESVPTPGEHQAWLFDAIKATPVAVYGRGNSSYARYNRGGDILNEAIRAVGSEELVPYTRGDEMKNETGTFITWLKNVATALAQRGLIPWGLLGSLIQLEHGLVRSNLDEDKHWSIVPIDDSLARLPAERRTVLHSTSRRHVGVISAVDELLADSNVDFSTCKIVVDVSRELAQYGSLVKHQPGDHVAIFPSNTAMVVATLAMHLGIKNLDQTIDLKSNSAMIHAAKDAATLGRTAKRFTNASLHQHLLTKALATDMPFPVPSTFRTVISQHLELTATPTQALLLVLASCVMEKSAREKLEALSQDSSAYEAEIRSPQVRIIDLFDLFPGMSLMHGGRVDGLAVLGALVSEGAIIKPRLYSIASSQRQSRNEIAVVVRKLSYRMAELAPRPRQGLASSFLCSRTVGQGITFQIRPCLTFQLPSDVTAPILMVAAGSGISPMRSFIEERLALIAQGTKLGKAVLVFGCRTADDQLLADEMDSALAAGAIAHYEVAFSRSPGHPHRYVQDAIDQDFSLASEACHHQGHVYVCGNANMAAGVIDTISSIIGHAGFEQLRADGRYHEDVYGYGDSVQRKKDTRASAGLHSRSKPELRKSSKIRRTSSIPT